MKKPPHNKDQEKKTAEKKTRRRQRNRRDDGRVEKYNRHIDVRYEQDKVVDINIYTILGTM